MSDSAQDGGLAWADWLATFEKTSKGTARVGELSRWPAAVSESEIAKAHKSFRKGEDAFLALNFRTAGSAFTEANERFDAMADLQPFESPILKARSQSAFFKVRSMLHNRQKKRATRVLTALIKRQPLIQPDPGIFPPDFREHVENVRRSVEGKGKAKLALTVSPASALVQIGGVLFRPVDGRMLIDLPLGRHEVKVGWPKVGFRVVEVTLEGDERMSVGMFDWPSSLPKTAQGHPAGPETLSVLKGRGVRAVVFVTDGEPLGFDGRVLYAQLTSTGEVVALVAMDGGGLEACAAPMANSLDSVELRTYRLEAEAVSQDEGLADAFRAYLIQDDIEVTQESPSLFGLSLDLGTGFGVATGVTDPGLAPTPFFVRPDLSYTLDDDLDIGLAARVQVVGFAFLAEPYVRWKLSGVHLRFGAAIGELNHKIIITENRNSSVEGLVGPAFGVEVPFGVFRLGAGLLAPVFPDQTIHLDLSLGVGL